MILFEMIPVTVPLSSTQPESDSTWTKEVGGAKEIKAFTGELGYDRLNGTRKNGPSYAKSVIYI